MLNIKVIAGVCAANLLLFCVFFVTQVYPWPLVVLQAGSIVYLIFAHIQFRKLWRMIQKHETEIYVLGAILALSLYIRLYRIEEVTAGMWGDEISVARMAQDLQKQSNFIPFVPTNFGHPTPLLYGTMLDMSVLGKTFTSIRLVSVIFGSFAVAAFYILLRQFFSFKYSGIGTVLFSFAYSNIIVSRFAYEMTAALLFQILSYLFLYLFWKKKKPRYLIFLGCTLGLGLWTYVAFRLFTAGLLTVIGILIWRQYGKKLSIQLLLLCLLSLGVTTVMLSSYSLRHLSEVSARVSSVSLFSKGLSRSELIKELAGGTIRTFSIFWLRGDPNPRQNPSQTSYIDFISLGFFYLGSFSLLRKNRKYLVLGTLLLIPLLLNDILATEFVPEFHYYGIGHPNALRLTGILPVVYGIALYGIYRFSLFLKEKRVGAPIWVAAGVVAIPILFVNYLWYFHAPEDKFIYVTNGVRQYKAALVVNTLNTNRILVSPSIKNDLRFQYFVNPTIITQDFIPSTSSASAVELNQGEIVVFDVSQDPVLAKSFIEEVQNNPSAMTGIFIRNTKDEAETLVFRKER